MPAAKPVPEADPITSFYWDAAREHRLVLQRCAECGLFQHPPDVACPRCQSDRLEPAEVSGRGVVYTFTVVRQAFDAAFVDDLPYIVALVELEEQPGLRLLTNIVDAGADEVSVGAAVDVTFDDRDGVVLPQFRLRAP